MRSTTAALLVVLAVTAAAGARATELVLEPLWTAGGTGSGAGEYGIPESVAIDSLGRVVVTDKGRMMLHVYDAADGRALFDVGSPGSGPGEFDRPNGIAVDRLGRILVVEQYNRRVQILGRDYLPLGSFGSNFQKPMGIAVHQDGSIYVTDESRADVQVFDSEGRHLWTFGQEPRLATVESIEIDVPGERIFVCDEGRSRVNVYDARGVFDGSFGGQGTGPGLFGNDPNAVRLDGRGRIYVNDQGNSRINVYDRETRFLASFRNTGRAMESADGTALSEKHNLFLVADQGNDRVIAFDLGEIQCRLAATEAGKSLLELDGLRLRMAGEAVDPQSGTLWIVAPLEFEASPPGGGLLPGGFGLLHVESRRDPRGVCVRLVETESGSGLYRARVELASESDEDRSRLATFPDDVLSAHLAGGPEILSIPVARYDPPRVVSLQGGQDPDGRLVSDAPRFTWRFEEDSGRRSQTAFEMRIEEQDGTLLWESGVLLSPASEFTYAGPAFPAATPLELGVRLASGRAWSAWATAPLRRNSPPAGVASVSPRNRSRVPLWPVDLRASVLPDPDGDAVLALIEIESPDGFSRTHPLPLLDGALAYRPESIALDENSVLRWRIVLSDGFVRVPTSWWSVYRNDVEEPPLAPRPLSPRQVQSLDAPPVFEWAPALDPDPETTIEYAVEWCADSSFAAARELGAGPECRVAWEGNPPAAPFWWRVRATDPTGHVVRSAGVGVVAASPGPRSASEIANALGSAVDEDTGIVGNVPSPILAGTRLRLTVPGSAAAVEIFDVRGRRLLRESVRPDGSWTWKGSDRRGQRIAPGIYWMRVRETKDVRHHKIVWRGG